MAAKVHDMGPDGRGNTNWAFRCPGCKIDHPFAVPRWSWNGSLNKPTFRPSLLCNADYPASRCHSVVTDGRIQFMADSFHALAGKTVGLPDWED